MKKYVKTINEFYNGLSLDGRTSVSFVPYLPKGTVSGREYNTGPDSNHDSVRTFKNTEIRISQKEDGVFIMPDGSYFVLSYKDPHVKPKEKYTHYFVFTGSDDSRVSLDKFRNYLDELQDAFGKDLKNTLVYARDMLYKVVSPTGEVLEEINNPT